ncbi:uncharacterized protein LOC128676932 isoform X1 [Plodia interpunctella]|uniref:uncharacterized protein LOC128676932 isoform X1 n=1 Tax=Plodia interpunctella TaxID=58824 RepID=UPI002367D7E4|nr:uncharacterized protein LOC128676932 isoform X1 [Plodia interpunctella]
MVHCCVLGCKSDSERKEPDLSFHCFPENDNSHKNWIKATGRINWKANKSSKICSRHFDESMLIKKKKRVLLLPGAQPSLDIKSTAISSTSSQSSSSMCSTSDTNCLTSECIEPSLFIKVEESVVKDEPSISYQEYNIETDYKLSAPNMHIEHTKIEKQDDDEDDDDDEDGDDDDDENDDGPSPACVRPPSASIPSLSHSRKRHVSAPASEQHQPVIDVSPKAVEIRMLKRKLEKSQIRTADRLKKIKALRQKNLRLTRKLANLENVIAELKSMNGSKSTANDTNTVSRLNPVRARQNQESQNSRATCSAEEGLVLESIDPTNRRDIFKIFVNPTVSTGKYPVMSVVPLIVDRSSEG